MAKTDLRRLRKAETCVIIVGRLFRPIRLLIEDCEDFPEEDASSIYTLLSMMEADVEEAKRELAALATGAMGASQKGEIPT